MPPVTPNRGTPPKPACHQLPPACHPPHSFPSKTRHPAVLQQHRHFHHSLIPSPPTTTACRPHSRSPPPPAPRALRPLLPLTSWGIGRPRPAWRRGRLGQGAAPQRCCYQGEREPRPPAPQCAGAATARGGRVSTHARCCSPAACGWAAPEAWGRVFQPYLLFKSRNASLRRWEHSPLCKKRLFFPLKTWLGAFNQCQPLFTREQHQPCSTVTLFLPFRSLSLRQVITIVIQVDTQPNSEAVSMVCDEPRVAFGI